MLPDGLFVVPVVFSSTGAFLESSVRPLLRRFAERAFKESLPADDDDVLEEMSDNPPRSYPDRDITRLHHRL